MRNQLRRFVGLVFLIVGLSPLVLALDPPVSIDSFVGTWQGQFQGKTFVTIKLVNQDGKLNGTVSRGSIQVDSNGELSSAVSSDSADPIIDTTLKGGTLRITTKDQESQDLDQCEMRLTGADQAELQLLGAPSGTPTPKPWKLTRVADASTAPATPAQDIKSKLAAAAQTWLSGQFGSGAASSSAPAAGSTALPGGTTTTPTASASSLKISDAALDATLRKQIDNLPRRVQDKFKNQGDMVNFVLVGSEKQVQDALQAASWHLADTDNKLAVINAIQQTYQKKDYLAMPMSTLYLFDRPQDFGYEEADPYAVVASRNHFRLWKASFTWNDQTVWVGAGTHDIGFEKDQRNGSVTHKIDPAVDGERDNIGATLQKANKAKAMYYYLPPNPVQEAKNATGGGYHSDGRLLVVMLQ